MSEKPRRRHMLELKIGGDEIGDILFALHEIRDEILKRGVLNDCVNGGPSCGYVVKGSTDDTITHDSYFADIERWLAESRHPQQQ